MRAKQSSQLLEYTVRCLVFGVCCAWPLLELFLSSCLLAHNLSGVSCTTNEDDLFVQMFIRIGFMTFFWLSIISQPTDNTTPCASMCASICMALFASLVIHTFQLVFSAGTVFFSHNESARTMFRLVFSAKRTGPMTQGRL